MLGEDKWLVWSNPVYKWPRRAADPEPPTVLALWLPSEPGPCWPGGGSVLEKGSWLKPVVVVKINMLWETRFRTCSKPR